MSRWMIERGFSSLCTRKFRTTQKAGHPAFSHTNRKFQALQIALPFRYYGVTFPDMDASTSVDTHHDPHAHAAEHEHHELGWWRKYIFSTDHKVIGIQYGLCGLVFLFFGFCLMMLMRWQLAYPGQALPVIGKWLPHIFGPGSMPDGKMTPDFYNPLGAMHGTIMIFAGVVPLAFAAFGNFVVPLQIGAPDMTFPKVNAASFWAFAVGGVIMMIGFFVPGGAAKSGWTSYTPLAAFSDTGPGHNPVFNGQTLWLIGFIFLISSSLLGAINFITTIIQLRAKGLTWMRLPLRVGAICHRVFVTAGIPAAGGCDRYAVNGPSSAHQLFPAGRSSGEWRAGGHQRRRQPAFVAAFVLVPRASRGLRADFACFWDCGRNSGEQFAQAALGLQIAGLFRAGDWIFVVHRVGPSHVDDGHGHCGQRIFPNDYAVDLHSISDHLERVFHFTVGRLHSLYSADAFRHRIPPDVWNRRPHRHPAGI